MTGERKIPLTGVELALRKCQLFSELDDEQIRKIAEVFRVEDYGVGETIFKQGEKGTSIYVIKKGQVSLQRTVNMGNRQANVWVTMLGTCRLLGCWACVLGLYRKLTESAVCEKETQVLVAKGADLKAVLEKDAHLNGVFFKRLCLMLGDKIQDTYTALDAL